MKIHLSSLQWLNRGMEKMISIIIRTFNEAEMLTRCLYAVSKQDYEDFEVIIVDSYSKDNTIEVAEEYNTQVVQFVPFTYGGSLNFAIEKTQGEYIAILSGHCIPTNDKWLRIMLSNFEGDSKVAGVYGRQFPVSPLPIVKRDMLMIFGSERRVQTSDPLFNNANSMIRSDLWKKIKFEEETHLEDRKWAIKVLQMGYKIIYEPNAPVHHYQNDNFESALKRFSMESKVLGLV